MKQYILASAKRTVLVKQGDYSDQVQVPRLYLSLRQAERFAAKYSASVYTVNAPAIVGNGYATYDAVKADAKALGLSTHLFSH